MEVLFVLLLLVVAAVAAAVPVVLLVLTFGSTRAVVASRGRSWVAVAGLVAALVTIAAGLSLIGGLLGAASDTACASVAPDTGESLEGGGYEQRAAVWPPGLRCRYTYRSGAVRTYSAGWGPVWFGVIGAAVVGGAMVLLVVGGDLATPHTRRRPHR